LHADLGSSAAQVCVRLTDEPPIVFHYESNRAWIVKIGPPSFDAGGSVEWGLRSEPLVLADDGVDQLEQHFKVVDRRTSHKPRLSFGHEQMMPDSA
jgi:hypothetical protein